MEVELESRVMWVSELLAQLRGLLHAEFGQVWVEGEISSLHRSRVGHVYFDLIDESGQLRCAFFRRAAERAAIDLEDGLHVRLRAAVDIYAERGSLQLIVEEVRPAGEGALRAAFERMKQRLADEGLFDPANKRPLPFMPARIGLVTSIQGAVVHDFVRGLRRRRATAEVVVYDARVQGDTAWREVVRGLHVLDADPTIEVIVLARGGGSMEDLWTFNREELVRAIAEAHTPVVSAIGHEVDVVLTDLVADMRAATPTAAADLVAPDGAELLTRVGEFERRLIRLQRARVQLLLQRVAALSRGLVHPARRLAELRRRLERIDARIFVAARRGLEREQARLARAATRLAPAATRLLERSAAPLRALSGRLDALSPLAVMARGFAIARRESDGAILRGSDEIETGAGIRVLLGKGSLRAQVTERES